MTSLSQTRAIHVLRKKIAGFADADYYALLREDYGVASSKYLTEMKAHALIAHLQKLAGPAAFDQKRAGAMGGPYAKTLQALWIAAYNLGVVEQRDDRALIAFVERQTGLSHIRFLHDPADAKKAIEGLKAWISREGGVIWPGKADPIARKRALLDAQTKIMQAKLPSFDPQKLGAIEGFGAKLSLYDAHALDLLSSAIGRTIRRMKSEAKRRAA